METVILGEVREWLPLTEGENPTQCGNQLRQPALKHYSLLCCYLAVLSLLVFFFFSFLVALVVNRKQKAPNARQVKAFWGVLCHIPRQPVQQPSSNFLSNHLLLSGNPFFRHTFGNRRFIRNLNKSELVAGDLVAGQLLVLDIIHRTGPSFLSAKARTKGARILKMYPLRRVVAHDLAIGMGFPLLGLSHAVQSILMKLHTANLVAIGVGQKFQNHACLGILRHKVPLGFQQFCPNRGAKGHAVISTAENSHRFRPHLPDVGAGFRFIRKDVRLGLYHLTQHREKATIACSIQRKEIH